MSSSIVGGMAAFAGLGLTLWGGYQYATAKHESEINRQKNTALKIIAAGGVLIAFGAGLICSDSDTTVCQVSEEENLMTTIEEVAKCPINTLKSILNAGGRDSMIAKIFKNFEKNQGISCDNYLPWQSEFTDRGYLDGVSTEYMTQPAMWGIDQRDRPYIATKYFTNEDQAGESAHVLIQCDTHDPHCALVSEASNRMYYFEP